MPLTLIILTGFTTLSIVGAAVGFLSHRHTSQQASAAKTWRDITHRGGVTAVSPWHSSASRYNAPGLVQVYPRSQQPTSNPNVQPERPAPVSIEKLADESVSATSETEELPLEVADEPNETEKEAVLKRLETGLSQSAIILAVWGAKSGGSAKYKAARERFQHYQSEVAADV